MWETEKIGLLRHSGMRAVTSLTFCDSERHEGFPTLTKVGSCVGYVAVMNPDPVGLVSGCVSYFPRRQGANVPEASIGLSMPVSGFIEPYTLRIVSTLSNAVIERPFMGEDVNVRIKITTSVTHGSGFKA
jgi:hypothetical protein